jgi:hypothetical protein
MPVLSEKKKTVSFNSVLADAKKLNAEDQQLLKIKLFGNDIIKELKAFESEMRKRKAMRKKSDTEIVIAVNKIRAKHAAK